MENRLDPTRHHLPLGESSEAARPAPCAPRPLGEPIIILSGYRSPAHNCAVGGAAFETAVANHRPPALEATARKVGFLGFGVYPRWWLIHVDLGPARPWG